MKNEGIRFLWIWTGLMLGGQIGFNYITGIWKWSFEFSALWIVLYIPITILAILLERQVKDEEVQE